MSPPLTDSQGVESKWSPVKAEDLREGDRVRVTLEGRVVDGASKSYVNVVFDRQDDDGCHNSIRKTALNAGKLERQERPLQVGDVVASRSATSVRGPGIVRYRTQNQACVDWDDDTLTVEPVFSLERVPS